MIAALVVVAYGALAMSAPPPCEIGIGFDVIGKSSVYQGREFPDEIFPALSREWTLKLKSIPSSELKKVDLKVEATIDPSGVATAASVKERSSSAALDDAAVQSIQGIHFPQFTGDKPVEIRLTFHLDPKRLRPCMKDAAGQQPSQQSTPSPTFVFPEHPIATTGALEKKDLPHVATSRPETPNNGIEILSDTQGVDFSVYVKHLKVLIMMNWENAMPEEVHPPLRAQGHVVIDTSITRDGKIAGIALHRPSGDVALDRAAWFGVTSSAPFPPLPAEFKGQTFSVRMHFYYNMDRDKEEQQVPKQ